MASRVQPWPAKRNSAERDQAGLPCLWLRRSEALVREAFCLSPLLSPAAKRAGVKPQGWGRFVCLGRHNLALQALSKWLSAVLAPPHALVMLTQGGFWDKPLLSRKLWASLVPMGKCGPWEHTSSHVFLLKPQLFLWARI